MTHTVAAIADAASISKQRVKLLASAPQHVDATVIAAESISQSLPSTGWTRLTVSPWPKNW